MVKAFVSAPANSTIAFGEGNFVFTNSLNLASAPGITVRGAGMDKTVIDFTYQSAGADGIVQNNPASGGGAVTFQDFTVKNTYGNGVKVVGAVGVTIRRVKALWTGAVRGPYGLYPVSCKNVLIEDSVVDGARDAGFYVGQSDTIIVRNNLSQQQRGGHRDREQLQRRRLRQHRHRQHRRNPGVRPARAAAARRAQRPGVQQHRSATTTPPTSASGARCPSSRPAPGWW